MANTPVSPAWFAIAVQALVMLGSSDGVCPSHAIAEQIHAHAVFLRRVMAELVRARLVEAREGRDGGYRLARDPDAITLADVYAAVRSSGPIDLKPLEWGGDCGAGEGFSRAIEEIVAETEVSVLEVLRGHTVGELMRRAGALENCPI